MNENDIGFLSSFMPFFVTKRDILANLPDPIPERTLRYDLAQLLSKGVVTNRGKGRATIWEKVG